MEERYHYYGDRIRGLFMITGILMVVTLPFFSSIIHVPTMVSIVGILALAILGGFLNPVQRWIIVADTFVAVFGFIAFEYYAVQAYLAVPPVPPLNTYFYWLNQIFALLFFLTVYLCIKTLRGKILASKS
ncbi:MAG: hypothetical protein QG566_36 [Patescibacteria group bacterium]|jgi:hypothetical protein|nr:hypothetical protein [Patescibacteria group bacterium]